MNDIEIIILQYYYKNKYVGGGNEFYQKHKDILNSDRVTLRSPKVKHNKALLTKNYKQHLVKLGLLNETFEKPWVATEPQFDYDTGRIKARDYKINSFGELFLKFLDLAEDEKKVVVGKEND